MSLYNVMNFKRDFLASLLQHLIFGTCLGVVLYTKELVAAFSKIGAATAYKSSSPSSASAMGVL